MKTLITVFVLGLMAQAAFWGGLGLLLSRRICVPVVPPGLCGAEGPAWPGYALLVGAVVLTALALRGTRRVA